MVELQPDMAGRDEQTDTADLQDQGLARLRRRPHSYLRQQLLPGPTALYRLPIRAGNRQVFHGISAAADNGSGLVRITRATHGYTTGDS